MPRWAVVGLLVLLGLAWRIWLGTRFYGWEESDYGNLAMVRGVLASGFTAHELDHMPLYYALGGALMAIVGDASIAARSVSMGGGLLALGLAIALADRVFGRRVAVIAGLLLIIQPEFALYSASSLREPLFAGLIMLCLLGLVEDRPWVAGLAAAAGFLVRFDAFVSLGLVLTIWVLMRRVEWRHRARSLLPLLAIVLLWAAYYHSREGTWEFWAHAAQRNVDTGLGEEALSPGAWWIRGLGVAWDLVFDLLPSRIGWGVLIGGISLVIAQLWQQQEPKRIWALMAFSLVGCWAGIGLVAQHDPVHNLYWKWLCPFIPVVIPLGVAQLLSWSEDLEPLGWLGATMLLALVLGQGAWVSIQETERQVERSVVLYGPQVELARWIEENVPESVPLLVDNIPGRYLERRDHQRALHSWMSLELEDSQEMRAPDGTEAEFALWLQQSGTGYVFWLLEEWTEAPRMAPFLRPCDWPDTHDRVECIDESGWTFGSLHLVEQARDSYCSGTALEAIGEVPYCWVFYRVDSALP